MQEPVLFYGLTANLTLLSLLFEKFQKHIFARIRAILTGTTKLCVNLEGLKVHGNSS